MQTQEVLADNIDEMLRYIRGLSYAEHGCLSLYWTICQKKSINARFFIENFPVDNRIFRATYHLSSEQINYQENRWKWVRKMVLKLKQMGFVNIEPLRDSPPLKLQPARLFANADYALSPRVSELTFQFTKPSRGRAMKDIVSVHEFLAKFVPRPRPPEYYKTSIFGRTLRNRIRKAGGAVVISFPISLA